MYNINADYHELFCISPYFGELCPGEMENILFPIFGV